MLGWPGALDWGPGETGVTRDGCMGGYGRISLWRAVDTRRDVSNFTGIWQICLNLCGAT